MNTINIHIEKLIDQVVIDKSVVEKGEIKKHYKDQVKELVTEALLEVMNESKEIFLISTDLNKVNETTIWKAERRPVHHYVDSFKNKVKTIMSLPAPDIVKIKGIERILIES